MKKFIIKVTTEKEITGVLEIIFKELNLEKDYKVIANDIMQDNNFHDVSLVVIFYNPDKREWSWMKDTWYEEDAHVEHLTAEDFINRKKRLTLSEIISAHIEKTKNLHFITNVGESGISIMCNDDTYYIDKISGDKQTIINSLLEEYGEENATVYISAVNKLYTIEVTSKDYNSILKFASENGFLEIVKLIIELGVKVTADNNCAVKRASVNGHLDVVKYLVKHGADLTANNNFALGLAAKNGHLDVVKYIVSHGGDVNAQDNYAIIAASQSGHLDIVKYLVKHGADITARHNRAVR